MNDSPNAAPEPASAEGEPRPTGGTAPERPSPDRPRQPRRRPAPPGYRTAGLLPALRHHTGDMEALLERLARIESPTADRGAQERVLATLRRELSRRGLRVRIYRQRGNPVLLAVPRGRRRGRPCQLLLAHVDTVWPRGTLDGMPVVRRDGCLYGPGTYDMKGGLTQMVFALEAALSLSDGDLPVTPVLLVTSDEETGSKASRSAILRLARVCDRVFVGEPSLGPAGLLKTTRKGVGRFTIRVEGRASHAGLDPESGASAILELSHVVQRLHALNDPARGTTVNVGQIDGGLSPNMVAPAARAEVDVRVMTLEEGRRVEERIHRLAESTDATTPGTRVRVEGRIARPPLERKAGNRRLWELAREAADDLGLELGEGVAGGGSDGNLTNLLAPTLDGLGAVGAGAHAVHEHVVVARMPERAALLARLLLAPPLGSEMRPQPDPDAFAAITPRGDAGDES